MASVRPSPAIRWLTRIVEGIAVVGLPLIILGAFDLLPSFVGWLIAGPLLAAFVLLQIAIGRSRRSPAARIDA